jgi:hypothetical protein
LFIISAERCPLLDIGLPQSSPRRSVLRCPHPAASRDLYQIVGPLCGGPTNAASPGTRSPFEDLSAPTAISPPRNVSCPLPLEVCNSSGYVSDLSSFTNLIVSDSITLRNEHSPFYCPLCDVEPLYKTHCKRPRLGSVGHHWQHCPYHTATSFSFPTLIPLSGVGTTCFSSCCDKDSAIIFTTGRLPDVNQTGVGANDCKCSRDQRLNVPSEARRSSR